MQTTKLNLTNNQSVHFKVVLDNEFRRFSLDKLNFTLLEQTIRAVYSLPEDNVLKICFVDDEKDLVLMTSDDEMTYALELTGQPVRLSVTIVNGPADSTSVPRCGYCDSSAPCRGRGGWGRGRGREEWKEERRKWKEEKEKLSPSDRLNRKTERISERIKHFESVLQTADLPANRQRCLNWRVEKLNAKLEKIKEKQTLIADADLKTPCDPVYEIPTKQQISENEHVPFHFWKGNRGGWGGPGCSRGGWGGPVCSRGGPRGGHHWARGTGCSRGGFGPHGVPHWARAPCTETNASTETVPCDREQICENLHTCCVNLKAARESGNQEEIEKCFQALREAKEKKRDAKSKKCLFLEEKAAKCACFRNLREARLSGDPEKIKQCEEALAAAKQTLKAAKVEYFLNKQ